MRMSWIAAAVLLVGGGAQAGELTYEPANARPAVGVGIICNTQEQAARFVSLVGGGQQPAPALNTINAEAHNPRACGVAAVAFIRDQTVSTRTIDNKLVQIVRINVVAGFNGNGWQRTTGMVQYAVIEGEGEAI